MCIFLYKLIKQLFLHFTGEQHTQLSANSVSRVPCLHLKANSGSRVPYVMQGDISGVEFVKYRINTLLSVILNCSC